MLGFLLVADAPESGAKDLVASHVAHELFAILPVDDEYPTHVAAQNPGDSGVEVLVRVGRYGSGSSRGQGGFRAFLGLFRG